MHAKRSCTAEAYLGGKLQPPWCFYSTTRRARPSAATRHTAGCSTSKSICSNCSLLGPVQIGAGLQHLALTLRHTRSPNHLQLKHQRRAHRLQRRFIRPRQPGENEFYIGEYVLSLWAVIHVSARISCDKKEALPLVRQGSYSSRSKCLASRFLGCETE